MYDSKIEYCFKRNTTVLSDLDEFCNTTQVNSCFTMWELNDPIQKIINVTKSNSALNLTEIIDNSSLLLKGCWVGNSENEDSCVYKKSPKLTLMCFCKNDNCNALDKPTLEQLKQTNFIPNPTTPQLRSSNQNHLFFYLFPFFIFLGLIFLFVYKQRNSLKKKFNCMNQSINAIKQNHQNEIEKQQPLISKSTPKLIELVRQGQYGNIYKGKIERRMRSNEQLTIINSSDQSILDLEQTVAIKAYSEELYDTFRHEYNVFNSPHLEHKNILKFISAEEKQINQTAIEYWLVLEYHENGSLYDYLKRNLITYSQLIEICLNIASGLSHLHNNNSCTIVHRDIKSKNILLKNDLTACISDFNLALVLYPNQSASENLDQVGTVR